MEDEALSIKTLCIHNYRANLEQWKLSVHPCFVLIIYTIYHQTSHRSFALKKHNPHMWGTNYQHPLHSTPFKNKSPATYYPFTGNSSWSIYKSLAAMLEQEEYGNTDSFWEPILAFWFTVDKPLDTSKQQGPCSKGRCVQVQCNSQALSSCTLRTRTDGTAAEMSERSWTFLLLCITLCSLPSEVTCCEALGKDVPSTSNRTITAWKTSNGRSQQCISTC